MQTPNWLFGLTTIIQGFEKQITKELVVRVAKTEEEGKWLAQFNAEIHGEELHDYVLRLYNHHPNKEEILWFYIEDEGSEANKAPHDEEPEEDTVKEAHSPRNHKIVSSMTLLPLRWKIREHEFAVAEMGFVGTKREYRGQGLFGIMNSYFDMAMKEREYVLSALVGIPYFYRKYGYEFALSKHTGYSMPTTNIPKEENDAIRVRKATEDDLEDINGFYDEYNSDFAVSTVFDQDKFQFRLMNTTSDLFSSITYIIEEDRQSVGFFCIGSLDDPQRADIILFSQLTYHQMIKVLQFVKAYNMGNINAFRIMVDRQSKFAQYLKSRGADPVSEWTWQIKIPDLKTFFSALKEVLEERIEGSMFKKMDRVIRISDYSDTVTLEFVEGKIIDIEAEREYPSGDVDLRIPSPHDVRLFLSDRSFDEINYIITDAIVKSDSKLVIETLFPKTSSLPFSFY